MIDIKEKSIGRWKILSIQGRDKFGEVLWLCKCSCGKIKAVRSSSLRKHRSLSCGCLNELINSIIAKTHGESRTHLYLIWRGVIDRCNNVNHKSFKNYGKRGITVCNEWRKSFIIFKDWMELHGYKDGVRKLGLCLDRIDNDKGYYPENCRLTTPTVNGLNTRNSRKWIVFNKHFSSSIVAGKFYQVDRKTIWNWCLGKYPRTGCSAKLIYRRQNDNFKL